MKNHPKLGKARLALIAAAIVLVVLGFLTLKQTPDMHEYDYVAKQKSGVGMLTGEPVTQRFTATENGLSALTVSASNYNKKLENGSLTLTLTDESGAVLAAESYPVTSIKKTQSSVGVTLTLPSPIQDSAGKTYVLSATSDCTEGKGITLKYGELETPVDGLVLTLQDGTVQEGAALMLTAAITSTSLVWMGSYTLWLLALCCLCCIPMTRKEGEKHA